jgi:hypothetical protein
MIRRIRLLRLIRPLSCRSHSAHPPRLRVVLLPPLQLPLAQKVFVVEQQLIEARAGNVYEPQLGLTRSRRRSATLGDVLTPAARRLDHLIMRSRPLIDEPIAESDRAVVDDLRYLK